MKKLYDKSLKTKKSDIAFLFKIILSFWGYIVFWFFLVRVISTAHLSEKPSFSKFWQFLISGQTVAER